MQIGQIISMNGRDEGSLQVQTFIFLIDIIINSLYIKPSGLFCLFFHIFFSNLGIFNILCH